MINECFITVPFYLECFDPLVPCYRTDNFPFSYTRNLSYDFQITKEKVNFIYFGLFLFHSNAIIDSFEEAADCRKDPIESQTEAPSELVIIRCNIMLSLSHFTR